MWQILTIVVLLGLMLVRRNFGIGTVDSPLDPASLVAIGFIILAAFTMGELFRKIKVPALLGYIVAGILFGPELAALAADMGYLASEDQAIFGREVIGQLDLIHVLVVGVIGTLGGGELKISELKTQAGTILTVLPMCFFAAVPLSAAAALGLATFVPEMVPFVADFDQSHKLAMALLFGIFGFAMSPTVTLAIMQETRSQGPFTSLTLAVVIAAELVLVASFLLVLNLAELLVSPDGFSTQVLLESLPGIAAEFGWAIVIGLGTGVVFILYLRYVAREMLLFTVGIIFAASAVSDMLHAEGLLVFIVAGFVVQNMSRHGHDMIHALEKISLPVFVIYFMTEAAKLDLGVVGQFLPLALILTVVRASALAGATKFATRLRDDPDYIDSNLWLAFFPLGSVDIVLAGMVADSIGPWGEEFRSVIIAIVVIHILTVPAVLKWVLDRVGETEEARKAGSEEVAKLDRMVGRDEEGASESLERPEFPDPQLNRSLNRVHDELSEAYQEALIERIERHGNHLQHMLERIETVRKDALDELVELLEEADTESGAQTARRVERLHVKYRRFLQPQLTVLDQIEPIPVDMEATEELLGRIQGLIDFDEHYRVPLEERLLEPRPDDGRLLSLVKATRRMRERLIGRAERNVPVGRLWRFYMELAVPGYLASAVSASSEHNEALWYHLGLHLRRIDRLFERVVRQLRRDVSADEPEAADAAEPVAERDGIKLIADDDLLTPSLDSLPVSMQVETDEEEADAHDHGPSHAQDAHDESSEEPRDEEVAGPEASADVAERSEDARGDSSAEEAENVESEGEPSKAVSALAFVSAERRELEEEYEEVEALLRVFITTLRERFSFSIEHAYSDFIEGVARAGTVELPSFRYRPSSRYDEAYRAEARLRARLDEDAGLAEGYQGWIRLDHQMVTFLQWYRRYQQRIIATVDTRFEQICVARLKQVRAHLEEALDTERDEDAWAQWYDATLEPAIGQVRSGLEQALTDFSQGVLTRRLMDLLEAHVARFSTEIRLLVDSPVESKEQGRSVETTTVPVRSWFYSKLAREAGLRLVEFNERGERTLRRTLVSVADVGESIQVGLGRMEAIDESVEAIEGAAAAAERAPRAIIEEAASRIDEIIENVRGDRHDISVWVASELTGVLRESAAPFLEHRLVDVNRELVRTERASLARRSVQPVVHQLERVGSFVGDVASDVARELDEKLVGEAQAPSSSQLQRRLMGAIDDERLHPPATYRRLFSSVPVDIPDFYIEREEVEDECARAVDNWLRSRPSSMLIVGERGMGKRSLVHHVLPAHLFTRYDFDDSQLITVRIDEDVETERELCVCLEPLGDGGPPRTLTHLERRLEDEEERRIVLVENGDQIYTRTPEGFELCERFLTMVERTSNSTLWIVLMSRAATTVLDTAIEATDYFTHVLELEPLDDDQIERMIMLRHQASGFDLEFEPPELGYLSRVRHPIRSNEALRQPKSSYFERLADLSCGNPLLALLYWRESIHLDAPNGSCIVAEALPKAEMELTASLSLQKKLILASLTQHQALAAPQLAHIVGLDLDRMHTELSHLRRLGFIEPVEGTSTYRLRPLPGVLVTRELRELNLV
ncbi:MAG: cation:proton antiporter [Persicimonas sp.]